jgi:hypothetical protein
MAMTTDDLKDSIVEQIERLEQSRKYWQERSNYYEKVLHGVREEHKQTKEENSSLLHRNAVLVDKVYTAEELAAKLKKEYIRVSRSLVSGDILSRSETISNLLFLDMLINALDNQKYQRARFDSRFLGTLSDLIQGLTNIDQAKKPYSYTIQLEAIYHMLEHGTVGRIKWEE